MWCYLNVDCWGGGKKALNIKRHFKFTRHLEGTKSKRQSVREREAAVTKHSFEFFLKTYLFHMQKSIIILFSKKKKNPVYRLVCICFFIT